MNKINYLAVFLFLFLGTHSYGQILTVSLNAIDSVAVGGGFSVSGIISHDANSPDITAGTPVDLNLFITDPSNDQIITLPTITFFTGFSRGRAESFNESFLMPWSEGVKWSINQTWQAHAQVTGGGNPVVSEAFNLILPDIQATANPTMPTDAIAGSFIDLSGLLSNLTTAGSEPQRFFKIRANIGTHTEEIIFPDRINFPRNSNWPIRNGAQDLVFNFPQFFIPGDTPVGDNIITITLDPQNIIPETDEQNNEFIHVINVGSETNATINASFYFDAIGSYQGLDPVKFKIVVRNVGGRVFTENDDSDLSVVLSRNNTFSEDDFILREIEIGGQNGLGIGLLPNETVSIDWVQMLPDNFEGDFYVMLVENDEVIPIFSTITPEISLRSNNSNEMLLASETGPQNTNELLFNNSGRPSTNTNGNLVTFEAFSDGVQQIFVKNIMTGLLLQVSKPSQSSFPDNVIIPNGASFSPKISPDGQFIVFHSFASNLVPGDLNEQSDIFLYDLSSYNSVASGLETNDFSFHAKLSKISNSPNGLDANGPSFYPEISGNGDYVVFESEANNLDLNGSNQGLKQIYMFSNISKSGVGTIRQITYGNKASFDASIDENGERIVFTTYATDLNFEFFNADKNNHSDVVLWENDKFYLVGRTHSGEFPEGGDCKEPVISLDGSTIAFQSNAPNMVSDKGIADISIISAGFGYTSSATVQINDSKGFGALVVPILSTFGEVIGLRIDSPGQGYTDPSLAIISSSKPLKTASAKPLLVNKYGDIFRIEVDSLKRGSGDSLYGSIRVSENQSINGSRTGGDERSREPSIDMNGTRIVYSSLASNLLQNQISHSGQKTFANNTFRSPQAKAILHGGIGKFIISNPGTGYPSSGSFLIQDLSGNGSGAVATYQVDSTGAIGSISIVNPGVGYDLDQTIIIPQNPGTGTGFEVEKILFPPITGSGINRQGGGSVHRVEMTDEGIGFSQSLFSAIEKPTIIVDGDGADQNFDGIPDAKIDPDFIKFDPNGKLFLEQHFRITVENTIPLLSTTLVVEDYARSITLGFSNADNPPFIIGIDNSSATEIRKKIIDKIRLQWGNPTDIFSGPLIDGNASGGTDFILKGLTAKVTTTNPSALSVRHLSNMLVQGTGYTQATPQVTPIPAIYGYSEITPVMTPSTLALGRNILQFQKDLSTDDIYMYDHNIGQNERINLSRFGYPVNHVSKSTMASSRFPVISANGRFIYFSSDANDLGGILFGNSNQAPMSTQTGRNIFARDLKSTSIMNSDTLASVTIDLGVFEKINFKVPVGQEMPISFDANVEKGNIERVYLYVDNQFFDTTSPIFPQKYFTSIFNFKSNRVGFETFQIVAEDNVGNIIYSKKVIIEIIEPNPEVINGVLTINPKIEEELIFIIQRTKYWHVLADTRTNIVVSSADNDIDQEEDRNTTSNQIGNFRVQSDYLYALTNEEPDPLIGPFTADQIAILKSTQDPQASNFNDAYYASDSVLNAKPLSYIYPPRIRLTTGSELNAQASFVSVSGKPSDLSHVNFYLNGTFIGSDYNPPYDFNFSPPSFTNDGKALTSWVITSQAVPLVGSSYMIQRFGVVDKTILFPKAILRVDEETRLQKDGSVYDGQEVILNAQVVGSSEILQQVNKGYFVANGIKIGDVDGVGTPNSDNPSEVNFKLRFKSDFSRYAEADGSIRVSFFGSLATIESHTPVYRSDPITLYINVPMPWVDDTSSALQLFNDFVDGNITTQELELFESIMESSQSPLSDWTEFLIEKTEFDFRIDLLAAYKIAFGDWHPEYLDYANDYDLWKSEASSSSFWMKDYIDSLLTSITYFRKYGRVPFLVGAASMNQVYNFGSNRRSFVELCLRNKYPNQSSYLQMNQGSVKILNFWREIETDYWELESSPDFDVPKDSPPRRDSNTGNQYVSGECAVEFIYRLVKEEKNNGFPYISYTEDYREKLFKKAAIITSLWKNKAFPLDVNLLTQLEKKSIMEVIEFAIKDYRYTSQFNQIWSDSDPVNGTSNWKNEGWFGYFMDTYFPWVYHQDLGWIYMAGVSPTNFWFYSEKLGWVWTGLTHYPALYSSNERGWIYFDKARSAYYSYVTNSWNSF